MPGHFIVCKVPVKVVIVAIVCLSFQTFSQQITNLCGTYRSGQVFLTWNESALAPADTLIVFRSRTAILDVTTSDCIPLVRLWPQSAHDVFRDDNTGYIIQDGGTPVTEDGLLVHTVYEGEEDSMFYAVVVKPAGSPMVTTLVSGQNTLSVPVTGQKMETIQPIWQLSTSSKPAAGASAGKPIYLTLHPKRLATLNQSISYVAFPDSSMGWQEGIPFKFNVSLKGTHCALDPLDATYVRRKIKLDDYDAVNTTNLIWTWWYGYNNKIQTPDKMASGMVVNYTERRVLWMIRWAQSYLGTDRNRTYIAGLSMGGCGGFSMGMHYPEVFSAVRLRVPNTFYNDLNDMRFTSYCGPLTTMTSEGMTLEERMNGRLYLQKVQGKSLPYVVLNNGRSDASMPWQNVPATYKALDTYRHGFTAAWNNGNHSTANSLLPSDIGTWDNPDNFSQRFSLDKSYPAFSNSSANQDPGSGEASNGDQTGYMNRNIDWDTPVESDRQYEVRIKLLNNTIFAPPCTVDVTIRHPQRFLPAPGTVLSAVNNNASSQDIEKKEITVDSLGLVTYTGFVITSVAGNRMVITAPATSVTKRQACTKEIVTVSTIRSSTRGIRFTFTAPASDNVMVFRIYDIQGHLMQSIGSRSRIAVWDGTSRSGTCVAPGSYLLQCSTAERTYTTSFFFMQKNT